MEPENHNFPEESPFNWSNFRGMQSFRLKIFSSYFIHQTSETSLQESLWEFFGPGLWRAYAFLITSSQCRWSKCNCGLGSCEWQCLLGPCFGRCETIWRGGNGRELEPHGDVHICFLSCLQRQRLSTSFLLAGTTCKSLLPWRDWFGCNRFLDTSNIVTWGVDSYFVGFQAAFKAIFASSLLSWIFMMGQSMWFISGMWYWSQKCYSGSQRIKLCFVFAGDELHLILK